MAALLIPMDRRRQEGWTRILWIDVVDLIRHGRRVVWPWQEVPRG